jgi:hypothetical protein
MEQPKSLSKYPTTGWGGDAKASSLFRLVGLMGREAYAGWSRQIRAGNKGKPPSQENVENMLAICEDFGEQEFKRMVQDEYCTRPLTSTTPSAPATGSNTEHQSTLKSGVCAGVSQQAASSPAVRIFKMEQLSDDSACEVCYLQPSIPTKLH